MKKARTVKHKLSGMSTDRMAGKENSLALLHFLSLCPKVDHAQTAGHNQVCKVLATSQRKHLAALWFLFHETPIRQTGLVLELVPTAVVLKSGRHISDSDVSEAEMSLGRWQPDFIAISSTWKKFANGPEVC